MSSTRKCETSGGVVGLEHNIWWWVVRLFRLQAARETTRGIIQLKRNLLDFSFPTSNNVKGLHTCTPFTICVHIFVFGLCEETHAGSQRTCNLHTDWPQPGSRPGWILLLTGSHAHTYRTTTQYMECLSDFDIVVGARMFRMTGWRSCSSSLRASPANNASNSL